MDQGGASLEQRLLPPFILITTIFHVLAMCPKTWIQGFYGDVSVTQFSPWFLCNIASLQCTNTKPHIDCFWMDDWANTDFELLGLIQHLDYWCIGALILAFIPATVLCCGYCARSKSLCVDIRQPVLLLLVVAAIVSTLSISLFSSKLSQPVDTISNYQELRNSVGPAYCLRVIATVTAWLSCFIALLHECRVRQSQESQLDGYMVVTESRTIEEVMEEENEEDGQLL